MLCQCLVVDLMMTAIAVLQTGPKSTFYPDAIKKTALVVTMRHRCSPSSSLHAHRLELASHTAALVTSPLCQDSKPCAVLQEWLPLLSRGSSTSLSSPTLTCALIDGHQIRRPHFRNVHGRCSGSSSHSAGRKREVSRTRLELPGSVAEGSENGGALLWAR
jgi:hypothetical protein